MATKLLTICYNNKGIFGIFTLVVFCCSVHRVFVERVALPCLATFSWKIRRGLVMQLEQIVSLA